MKYMMLIRTVLVLALSLSAAQAFDFSQLSGKWTGQRKEIYGGTGAYSKVTLKAELLPDGGLLIVEKGKWPKLGHYTWRHRFHADGRYNAIAKNAGGLIYATTKGTWLEDGEVIRISGQNWNLTGSSDFKGSISSKSGKRLEYSGKSGTARVVLIGRR
jgi:hypothetical protein